MFLCHLNERMAGQSLTSVRVRFDVVRRLRTLKSTDQTWDDFLMGMPDVYVRPGWHAELAVGRGPGIDSLFRGLLKRSRALAKAGHKRWGSGSPYAPTGPMRVRFH